MQGYIDQPPTGYGTASKITTHLEDSDLYVYLVTESGDVWKADANASTPTFSQETAFSSVKDIRFDRNGDMLILDKLGRLFRKAANQVTATELYLTRIVI